MKLVWPPRLRASEAECVYFDERLSVKSGTPKLEPFHGSMAEAQYRDPMRKGTREVPFLRTDGEALKLVVNVYDLAAVFVASGWNHGDRLIAREDAAEAIVAVSRVQTRPVELWRTYLYPYVAGNGDFERDSDCRWNRDNGYDRAICRLRKKYACAAPKFTYFELVFPNMNGRTQPVDDVVRKTVREPGGYGFTIWPFEFSRSLIQEFGIIESYGYACTRDVFNVLIQYLRMPYWWYRPLKYSQLYSRRARRIRAGPGDATARRGRRKAEP